MDCEQSKGVQGRRHADGSDLRQKSTCLRTCHSVMCFASSWMLTSMFESRGIEKQPTHVLPPGWSRSFFQAQYDRYTLEFDKRLFVESANSFRHQLTGGIRPEVQSSANEQRKELLRMNLTHVFHENYCKLKENFPPLPSFPKLLSEQTELLQSRLDDATTASEDEEMEDNWGGRNEKFSSILHVGTALMTMAPNYWKWTLNQRSYG